MKAGGQIQGKEQVRGPAFLGDPVEDGGFRRAGRWNSPETQQTVDDHAQNDSIEWLADESLQRGDCIVETRDSRVDARWRQRAAATVHAVLGEGSA